MTLWKPSLLSWASVASICGSFDSSATVFTRGHGRDDMIAHSYSQPHRNRPWFHDRRAF